MLLRIRDDSCASKIVANRLVAPSTTEDAYGLLRPAIDDPDPVMVVENLLTYWTKGPVPKTGHRVPLGKAKVTAPGTDIMIVSYSRTALEALGAHALLAKEGISAEVIDLRTVSPWDQETVIASVGKTGRLLVAHEAVVPFGVGAEIAAVIQQRLFGKLKAPVGRIGAPFRPVPFSQPLEVGHITDAPKIAEAAAELVRS